MTRNRYKSLAERHADKVKSLTRLLNAEKRLNAALSKLSFSPMEKQDPEHIRQLKRANTEKKKLLNSL